ncbi:aquaporin-like protein [Lasiosphaeria miniovina]|uniref:Aquaporin-like protein n=1 Tax=Lasiosphaeria miniovina TaxID=1954250 RepID=A0AA40DIV3_9PEZI|nr:aquaporin-like protein [Lasiosphaeria miniovina]KAK0702966.1 aquaporin-like protein [Lasiosphaeria miniovina]
MRPPNFRFPSFASAAPASSHDKTSPTLPMLSLPTTARNNIVAALGEFVGTFLFLFFAFAGTQVANTPPPSPPPAGVVAPSNQVSLIFISLAFGTSLTANVWAFYRVTGGLFNPAVTLSLVLVGGLPAVRALLVVPAQLLGGIAAAGVVSALLPGPMAVETTLGGGASVVQGLFIEMFLTAELVFVIIMLAAEKHKSTYLAPVAIGISFFLAELVGVYYTGGSLNPARSLGPATVNRSFPGYFWIYWVGPLLGSLLASAFYTLLKFLRWKEVNPGQDWNDSEKLESERRLAEGRDVVEASADKRSGSSGRADPH